MQSVWLNKNNNKELIVFFNGWGMDEKIVSNLTADSCDVLVLYDYRTFDIEIPDFTDYEKKYLIAWSMGVYVCNYFFKQFKDFDSFTAINGTQKPVDNDFGIPNVIYDLTVRNFNELSCKKFMKKITSDVDLKSYCSRDTEALKKELITIRDLKCEEYFKFNKAFVSLQDKIFPPKNQLNFWNKEGINTVELDMPHSIFDKFTKWSDLL